MQKRLNKLNNLQQRAITALAGVIVIIGCILYSDWTCLLLFLTISSLTQLEFYKLLGLDGNQPLTYYGTFCGTVMMLLAYLIEKEIVPFENYFIISPLLSMIFFIKLYKKNDLKPFTNIGFTFLGIIYVALPFSDCCDVDESRNLQLRNCIGKSFAALGVGYWWIFCRYKIWETQAF